MRLDHLLSKEERSREACESHLLFNYECSGERALLKKNICRLVCKDVKIKKYRRIERGRENKVFEV